MSRKFRNGCRRLMAFVLSTVMVISNISANTGTVYAAEKKEETEIALFMLDGREILDAVQDLDSQQSFDLEDLELEAARRSLKKEYEKLLEPEKGKVYALTLTVDDRMAPEDTRLMAFYRTATEDVVFLFINESSEAYQFCVNIDGYETKLVKVDPASVYVERDEEEEEEKAGGTVSRPAGGSGGAGSGASGGSGSAGSSSSGGSGSAGSSGPADGSTADRGDENISDSKGTTGHDRDDHTSSGDAAKDDDRTADNAADAGVSGGTADNAGSTGKADGTASDKGGADKGSGDAGTSDSGSSSGGAGNGESGDSSSNGAGSMSGNSGSNDTKDSVSDGGSSSSSTGGGASDSGNSSSGSGNAASGGGSDSGSAAGSSSEGGDSGSADSGSKELSISYHQTAFVAVPLEDIQSGDAVGGAAEEEEAEVEETTTTEAKEEEGATKAQKEDPEESSPVESESAPKETEEPSAEESTGASGAETQEGSETEAGEGTPEAPEGTSPEESTEKAPEESTEEKPTETGAEEEEGTTTSGETETTAAPADAETEEAPDREGGQTLDDGWEIPGKAYKSITIWNGATTRAYLVALGEIEKVVAYNEALETLQVDYQVLPDGAAKIVGADTVKIGGTLYFAVEPEEDFQIISVMANGLAVEEVTDVAVLEEAEDTEDSDGEDLEDADLAHDGEKAAKDDKAESLAEWKKYEHVYKVEAEDEDLVIEVGLDEKLIPAKVYTAETDDAVFTVDVPDGAFAEEVELKAKKIKDEEQLKVLADQAEGVLEKEKVVSGILAYDISFVSLKSGEEIEPAKAVSVSIRVKKPMVSAQKERGKEDKTTEISVVHLPDEGKAEVVATTEDRRETEFAFEADSFSIFIVATVEESDAAASINGERKDTLQEAIDAVTDEGATIYLLHDVAEDIVSNGKSYTLDMRGNTLTNKTSTKNVYTVNGGTVVIKNGTIDGDELEKDNKGRGISVTGKATLTIENCTVKRCSYSGIKVDGGSAVTLDKQSIVTENVGNGGYGGGGILANNGSSVCIKGGTKITQNTATGNGHAIRIMNSSELTTEGEVEIRENGNGDNRGIVEFGNGSGVIKGTKFIQNKNTSIIISNTQPVNVSLEDLEFRKNIGSEIININNSSPAYNPDKKEPGVFTAKDCSFIDNQITGSYGGIYLTGKGVKKLDNCRIADNTGNGNSIKGIFYFADAIFTAELNECMIEGNKGSQFGAIYNKGKAVITINDSSIVNNEGMDVGAIYTYNTSTSLTSTAKGSVKVLGSIIKDNKGSKTGGVYVECGSFQMEGGALYNNQCQGQPNDVKLSDRSISSLPVEIMAADTMSDDGVDFKGYIWKQVGGTDRRPAVNANGEKIAGTEKLKSSYWQTTGKNWFAFQDKAQDVAQIGDKTYGTIQEALDAAKAGDTIKLIVEAISVTEPLIVDKDIAIDINGCKLVDDIPATVIGGIKVQTGHVLSLAGQGEVGLDVDVSVDGTLKLDGTAKFTGSFDNSGTLEFYENVVISNTIKNKGNVIVAHHLDALSVAMSDGSFELSADADVGKLTIEENDRLGSPEAVINGSVGELILKQSGEGSKGILNGSIDTLRLGHYVGRKYLPDSTSYPTYPMTYAGEGFRATVVEMTPSWDTTKRDDAIDSLKPMDDIIMIKGLNGWKITDEQVGLEQATWKDPMVSDGSGVYKFLIKVALSEEGEVVLHKSVSDAIYLGGADGSDEGDDRGLTVDKPVVTFEKAIALADQAQVKKIYIVGAVTVSGKEEWTAGTRDIVVQRYPSYTGELIRIPSGGNLTLQSIIIDGGIPKDGERIYQSDCPMIMNESGGTLTIGDKAVLQNNDNKYSGVGYEGGAIRNAGTLTMQAGTIQGNQAVSGGGVFNCGSFTLSGGEIKANHAKGEHRSSGVTSNMTVHNAGGGVFIAGNGTMTMTGGTIADNSAYIGGGIALGNDHNVYVGGTLSMESGEGTSGVVSGNVSEKEGGGIFVQMGCEATITAGSITDNTSNGGAFGGGGIYVNGGSSLLIKNKPDLQNGKLTLKNVKISENTAGGTGGGIAACPSAAVRIYLKDGGLIHNNNSGNGDIYINNSISDYIPDDSAGRIYISRYMIDGSLYKWKDIETGEEVPSRRLSTYFNLARHENLSIYSAAEVGQVDDFSVFITRNTAPEGGGIGANGEVVIGEAEPDTETFDLQAKKVWVDETGAEISADTLKEILDPNLAPLEFTLWRKLKGDPGADWEYVEHGFSDRNAQYEWSTCVFPGLRKTNKEGKEWEYEIRESSGDAFILDRQDPPEDEKLSVWTFYNLPVYSLKVSKTVKGMVGDADNVKRFTFTITLKDRNGTPYQGELKAVDQDGQEITVIADGGQITQQLGHGESILIKGLSAGTSYSVQEMLDPDHDAASTGSNGTINGRIVKETEVKAGVNLVEFINTPKEPHGNLTIRKEVAGKDGDREKEWSFTVKLTKLDPDGNEVALEPGGGKIYEFLYEKYGEGGEKLGFGSVIMPEAVPGSTDQGLAIFSNEVGEEKKITLAHGQYITIYGLPLGTRYAVTEIEADSEHYRTSVEGDAVGEIKEKDQLVEVKYVNARKAGNLEIKKNVSGIQPIAGKRFSFTLTLDTAINGVYGDVTFTNGVATFELADQGVAKVVGLPEGASYTVEEDAHDGYTSISPADATGIIGDGTTIQVDFINVIDAGQLSIQKSVTGQNGDKSRDFTFIIALTGRDGNALAGTYPYIGRVIEEGIEIPQSGSLTLSTEGEAKITLKHGQKITISGLPADTTYKVTEVEADQDGYKTTEVDVVGSIEKDREKTAAFVNDRSDIPDEPTPNNPGTPSRPPRGSRDRTPSTPTTNITPEPVPLAAPPQEDGTPLIPIDDESVPLFGMPRTGDRSVSTGALIGMMVVSLMAACGIYIKKRKED